MFIVAQSGLHTHLSWWKQMLISDDGLVLNRDEDQIILATLGDEETKLLFDHVNTALSVHREDEAEAPYFNIPEWIAQNASESVL
jgi:hypothetical protein